MSLEVILDVRNMLQRQLDHQFRCPVPMDLLLFQVPLWTRARTRKHRRHGKEKLDKVLSEKLTVITCSDELMGDAEED